MAERAGRRRKKRWERRAAARLTALLVLAGALVSGTPGAAQTPPLPPPRPDGPIPPEPAGKKPSPEEAGKQQVLEEPEAEAACIARLTALGFHFEKHSAVQEDDCKIDNPISVSGLPNGVAVSPDALVECSFAEALAHWVSDVVAPRADEHFQGKPTKILIGTSYQCRDQRSGEKLSEHAFGNGVDVMGFEFDKHPPLTIKAQAGETPEAAFQSAIRKEACSIFSTVLGPGADSDHGDHLHLDMRQRKADYRICQ